jgi:hypothetical protein
LLVSWFSSRIVGCNSDGVLQESQRKTNLVVICRTWESHSGPSEGFYIVGYNAV